MMKKILKIFFSFIFTFLLLSVTECEKSVVEKKEIDTKGSEYEIEEEDLKEEFIKKGVLGDPCSSNEDCESGFCIELLDGKKVCTIQCWLECPEGWKCEKIENTGQDVIFICISEKWELCKVCKSDDECGDADDYCIEVGLTGKYCGLGCENDEDCPLHFLCKEVLNSEGIAVKQCIPDTGSCVCTYEFLEKKRPCIKENEFGKCFGEEECKGEEGWVGCNAKEPKPEECNGEDDNCNGEIDEGLSVGHCEIKNEFGICDGIKICKGSKGFICIGKEAEEEKCDGIDNDCDKEVDEENAKGCLIFYKDKDKDEYGVSGDEKCLCKEEGEYSAIFKDDCDDNNENINPSKIEVCNGYDDNCNQVVDEDGSMGCKIYYVDNDKDGYGAIYDYKCKCNPDEKYKTEKAGDCDDNNPLINTGAKEKCDNLDNNCLFGVDEGCDKDEDGYCAKGVEILGWPEVCVFGIDDCNDNNSLIHPSAIEQCDGIDNNCNGEIDEGVKSPCGGCNPLCEYEVGAKEDVKFDEGEKNGVNVDEKGEIKLDSSKIELPFIWIANSGQWSPNEKSVSKINTETGCELARYNVCSNPSRTAVDKDGNVWTGCRLDGKVAKISIFENECVDKNKNGKINTSFDANKNCVIDAGEILPEGQDECVKFVVQPDGAGDCGSPQGCARAVGVDKDNYGWIGFWGSKRLRKLSPDDGKLVQTINLSANPYGLAIDKNGIIWVSGRGGNKLLKVDPSQGKEVGSWGIPQPNAYGIAIDPNGAIWVATGESQAVARFNPANEKWNIIDIKGGGYTRGVAISQEGIVYIAHNVFNCAWGLPNNRYISMVDSKKLQYLGKIDLNWNNSNALRGAVGMAIDFDGYIWAVNMCSSTVSKIDPKQNKVIGEYPTGPSPYTYSDMTGYALRTIVSPTGYYRHIFKGWDGKITYWDYIYVEATIPPKTNIKLRHRTAKGIDELKKAKWSDYYGPFPPQTFPLKLSNVTGNYFELEVSLHSEDKKTTPILKKIEVISYTL